MISKWNGCIERIMPLSFSERPIIRLPAVEPITLTWEKVTITALKTSRILLHEVKGIAQPGELIALMGAR